MKKKRKKSNWAWLYEHRLIVFLVTVFVILPAVLIPTVYNMAYHDNKPILFETPNAKVINYDEMTHFDINYKLKEVREPNSIFAGGYYKLEYTITKKNTVNQLSNITIQFQLSTTWERFSQVSPIRTVQLNTLRTETIAFNQDMSKDVLPFVKPGGPYIFAKITYTETILSENFVRTEFIRLPYDLVKDGVIIIPA